MAYYPYSAVNGVYKEKENWTKANQAGDINAQNMAAENAKKYYDELIKNGYEDVANELQAANYEQAKAINDKWAKHGKTATRDYLYTLGQSKGMSNADVDKLIGWDDSTKEVTFGGKKMGSPDAIVDGVSYWSDTSVLDNAFNDYIKRTGTTISDSKLQGKYNNDIQDKTGQRYDVILGDRDKYNSEYDKVMGYANQDITQTDEYKSIFDNMMKMFSLDAMQGRNNEVANGAASNGGNIDSYAAANALRQQAAVLAKGQVAANQAGLDAYNSRVNNITNILDRLGIYQKDSWNALGDVIDQESKESQRLFENDETAKNNEVDRQGKISAISGKVGDTVTKMLNSNIFNADGSLTNYDENFRGEINVLRQLYNSTTDESVRASLWERMRILELARNQKIDDLKLNAEKTYEFQGALPQTEEGRQYDKSDATILKTLESESANKQAELDAEAKNLQSQIEAEERMNTANNASAEKIAEVKQTTSTTAQKNTNKNEIDATISHWLYSPWADFDESVEWKTGYSDGTHRMQYIAAEKMKDPETRSFVKAALVAGGYTESEATKKLKEYEQNIAAEIAQIEHKDYQDKDVIKSIKKRYGWS